LRALKVSRPKLVMAKESKIASRFKGGLTW
jgi:hypothetical protein